MFAKFENLPGAPGTEGPGRPGARPLDWHALRARLGAEQELRNSFRDHDGILGALGIEGSFDRRAAEALIAQAIRICDLGFEPDAGGMEAGARAAAGAGDTDAQTAADPDGSAGAGSGARLSDRNQSGCSPSADSAADVGPEHGAEQVTDEAASLPGSQGPRTR